MSKGIYLVGLFVMLLTGACNFSEPSVNDYALFVSKAKWYESVDELDSAKFFYESALVISTHSDSILKLNLNLADLNIRLENAEAATELVRISDSLISQMPQVPDWFRLRRIHVMGKLLYLQRNYDAAIKLFDPVLDSARYSSYENSLLLVRIYNYRGIISLGQSRLQTAMESFEKADSLCKKWNIGGWDQADIIQNIGITLAFQGNYDNAGMYFEKSKNIREALYGAGDKRLKSFYLNYARYMYLLSNVETSLKYNQLAEGLFLNQRLRNEETFGKLLLNIGNNYTVRNDFDKAMVYYRNALNAFSKTDVDKTLIITTKINLAFALNQLGYFDESITLLNDIDRFGLQNATLAKINRNIAFSFVGLGDRITAIYHFRKYIEYAEVVQNETAELGLAYNTLGEFLIKGKEWSEAIVLLKKAENEYAKTGTTHLLELFDVYRNLARSHFRSNQFDQAEYYFKLMTQTMNSLTQEKSNSGRSYDDSMLQLRITDYYLSYAEFYMVRNQVEYSRNNLFIAFEAYSKAFTTMESLTISLSDESWLKLNERLQPHYQNAVEVAYQLYKKTGDNIYSEAAFGFTARSKAVLLMSSLRQSQSLSAGLPPEVSGLERSLKAEILSLGKLVAEEQQKQKVNANRMSYLENKHFHYIRRYDSLLKVIENEFPAYYSLRFNPTVTELSVVQKNLTNDELMVEYLLGDSTYYIFGIGKNDFSFERRTGKAELLATAQRFRTHCAEFNPNFKKADLKLFLNESVYLYNELIYPLHNQLDNRRLVVVPDGSLGYLPFELLLPLTHPDETADTTKNFALLPFLFTKNPVSYVYSSGMRLVQQLHRTMEAKGFLAFAPEYKWAKQSLIDSVSPNLQSLPFASEEAIQLADFWNGETMLDEEATKQSFIHKAGHFQILHLAMHGLINDEKPQYSRLVFQPAQNVKQTVLETYELYSLSLNADLVVLSACNTGSGKVRMGEGVISLSRGFLFAGVPSIVMTGWEVNDKSGSELTLAFYRYLRDGFPKDIALQKAKLDYLANANLLKSHPFFWASYMVVGDNKPLVFRDVEKNLPTYSILIVVAVFILLTVLVVLYRVQQKKASKTS